MPRVSNNLAIMSGNKNFRKAHRFARSEIGCLTDNLPKLQSERPFSPDAYNAISAPIWRSVHDLALALDYPTTVMAFTAASEKPVLFTDIGFRRICPMALDRLIDRCHYARIDMQAPEEVEKDLDRVCVDRFTPNFSNDPKDEGSLSVARAIGSMI